MHRAIPLLLLLCTLSAGARAVPGPACDPLPGSETLLRPGVVVLLGEIHGAAEAPAALLHLTCLAAERGLPVTVGLEIPHTGQARVARYVAGPGGSEEEKLLLSGAFWQRDYQDGRTSRAMFELIEHVRRLRADSADVRVVLIDDPRAPGGRDRAMAERLAAARTETPEALVVALTGNIHNRLTLGTRWNAAYEPMGFLLRQLHPEAEVVSLNLTHAGGTAWICTSNTASECGARELGGRDDAPYGIDLYPDAAERPYSGQYHIGTITASPPAVGR